jgi:hypothetical protein
MSSAHAPTIIRLMTSQPPHPSPGPHHIPHLLASGPYQGTVSLPRTSAVAERPPLAGPRGPSSRRVLLLAPRWAGAACREGTGLADARLGFRGG